MSAAFAFVEVVTCKRYQVPEITNNSYFLP